MTHYEGELRASASVRFGIVASRWNPKITDVLLEGARVALTIHGVHPAQVDVVRVPGAWEIAQACEMLARSGRYAALMALGCVVRGDTRHFEHVADQCAQGLMQVSLRHNLPIANGVLAVEQHADAVARAGGSHGNKGEEVALVAIEMVDLAARLATDEAHIDGAGA